MPQFLERGHLKTQDLLSTCYTETAPSGDTLFTSTQYQDYNYSQVPGVPFRLAISPQGITDKAKLINLCDSNNKVPISRRIYSGVTSFVTRENIGGWFHKKYVALKRLKPYYIPVMDGIEYFKAIRALEDGGVLCASPLIATRYRYISRWVSGQLGNTAEVQLRDYLWELEQKTKTLKNNEKWNQDWAIDEKPDNFIVINLDAENPLERFIAIDPVYVNHPS